MKTIRLTRERITATLGVIIMTALGGFVVCRELAQHAATERANVCANNLLRIDAAKGQWAWEHGVGPDAMPAWEDIQPYLGCGDTSPPRCPDGGNYTLGKVMERPQCSVPGHVLK